MSSRTTRSSGRTARRGKSFCRSRTPRPTAAGGSNNVGVVGVQFKLDGRNLGAEVATAPYAVAWVTTTGLDGAHTLTAVARDAAGNVGTAAGVSVTVLNSDTTPPTVSIAAPGS